MSPSLSELPSDVLLIIAEQLDPRFALRLSAVSSRLRGIIARVAFKRITFTSDEASAESALAAVRKHGQWTQELDFFGTSCARVPRLAQLYLKEEYREPFNMMTNSDLGGYTWGSSRRCLCKAAEELLRGVATPHLQKIRLELYFPFERSRETWGYDWDGDRPFPQELEDYQRTETEEAQWFWRAFSAAVWRAIANNKTITKLTVAELMPKPTTVFSEDSFRQLLGRLREFDISIFQKQRITSLVLNKRTGFLHYLRAMAPNFFDHLASVEHLQIRASFDAPMGTEGPYGIKLPLDGRIRPHLKTLELQNCFVGPELVKVVSNSSALKELMLTDCHAYWDERTHDRSTTWEQFFLELPAAGTRLTRLVILPLNQPLSAKETVDWKVSSNSNPVHSHGLSRTSRDIRHSLGEDPQRRLFGYASLSLSGFCIRSDEINVSRFYEGGDLKAYNQVLEFLKQNRGEV